ncbi:MAG: arsenosugar biosynthesis radical SAM protein ArsS [Gordonibacter sp.]|uniref:arsenosugar biosynthesis radical SAM (seleno)protein ArsS n=1 Tax=Gordonibacter sp. TaxID=1968902 RepID=UPI002FCB4997
MSSCHAPARRVFKDAGRVCPVDYRIAPESFAGDPERLCDVLYVVGGLYGNPFALDAVEKLAAAEAGETLVVLNGDAHWFDKTADNFEALERRLSAHVVLVGNVEAELRRQVDVGVGCGCAYPDCTADDAVSRSNRIHKKLSEAVEARPGLKALLEGRPSTLTVGVAGKKVAVTHGDEQLLGGWACSRESLQDVLRQDELDCWLDEKGVDVLATTHTCAPAAVALAHGLVINNGAAGLSNFSGQHFGLAVRIACGPHPDALFTAECEGLFVEAVPVHYDHEAYLSWFDELWPETSPAAVSYRSRIADGPDDYLEDSLLGGFRPGPAARVCTGVRHERVAAKDEVRRALSRLVYFEDRVDDTSCLDTVEQPSTLQVNITARCNLACAHCHVEAGPHRSEAMGREVLEAVLSVAARPEIKTVDVTGGAPEMHPDFGWFIGEAARVAQVMVRTNLVVLRDEAYRPLLDLYAELDVEVVASLPNVFAAQAEAQRGRSTFDPCLDVLRELNRRGYGHDGAHVLNLVFNPQWPLLPPEQDKLERVYRRRLGELGITFDRLFAVANNPIGRYGAHLIDTGAFDGYLDELIDGFNQDVCAGMMCRDQMTVGWDGRVYDCDFNHVLGLVHKRNGRDLTVFDYADNPELTLARSIRFRNHCYACAAGQGSSCGGTIVQER